MPFSSLSSQQKISVRLLLIGGPAYAAQANAAARATTGLGAATATTGLAMRTAGRRSYLMNQALFTLHRYSFLATTTVLALGVGLIKLGVSYNSALDQARAALQPLFSSTAALNEQLQILFRISKYSPFVLSDMTTAFRKMFPAFRATGMGLGQIDKIMQAMVDTLSFAGRTTPAALQQITYAFQHMFFQGRLTGRLIQQLANSGVNVHKILGRLGVQGTNISNIARLNISPERFTQAFLAISGERGVAGAAQRLALHSFAGALQVARDSLSQFMGVFIGGAFNNARNKLIDIIKPGGPLDRLVSIQKQRGNTAAIMAFSQMISGGTGLGKGLLFLGKLIKDIGNFFLHIWVPALVQAFKVLVVFYPPMLLLDKIFVFLNRHAKLAKFIFTIFAAALLLASYEMIALWFATRLTTIATFGFGRVLVDFLIPAFINLIGLLGATAVELIAEAGLWWALVEAEYANVGALAAIRFAIFNLPIIGWLLLIIATLGTLYFKWQAFHDAVNTLIVGTGRLLFKWWIDPLRWLIDHLNAGLGGSGFLSKVIKRTAQGAFGGLPVFGAAGGGIMPSSGPILVGEAGPELLSLPAGSRITPLNTTPVGSAQNILGGDNKPQVIQLVVDRRVLAEVVARAEQDKKARR